jgi:hypothetical protein
VSSCAISVIVSGDGELTLWNWTTGSRSTPAGRIDLSGLDGRVLRIFERWLTERDRSWLEEDIRVFGQLLHRRLFPGDAWSWVRRQAADVGEVRLMLAFPVDGASSRLAALPWEFLCQPDRPDHLGEFLVLLPWLTLSRVVPSGVVDQAEDPPAGARILPVVGEAHSRGLGPVLYEEVLAEIEKTSERPGFSVLPALVEVTEDALAKEVRRQRPDVVHYLGHGRFRDEGGAVALKGDDGGTEWVSQERLARALCSAEWSPSIVILHACEGGASDYEYRYAGLAPSIVIAGVRCVIAMQYPVTNAAATLFSTTLYAALADHASLDRALQVARRTLWETSHDLRLLGIPMIYQSSPAPLLAS